MLVKLAGLVRAAELMATAVCPLDCSYCYIPKSKHMKEMHEEILERIRSGAVFDDLEYMFGNNLEYFGLWGAEPSIMLSVIAAIWDDVMKRFPKIKEVSYSTSMVTDPALHVPFIEAVSKYNIQYKLQISIDGPAWINDANRAPGNVKLIEDNLIWLIQKMNEMDLGKSTVEIRWKATHSPENMRAFMADPSLIDDYNDYFKAWGRAFDELNTNPKVLFRKDSYVPTLVVPGKYTTQDGRDFAKFLKLWHGKGLDTTYTFRYKALIENRKYFHSRHQSTCSGGDSNFGIGKMVHLCHRTFFLNDQRYIDSILSNSMYENWDVSLFEGGMIDHIKKNVIVDMRDELEFSRFLYMLRGYHDFMRLSSTYTYAMVKMLAKAGQADPVYLTNNKLAEAFAYFVNVALSCPMENIMNTGSIHLQVISLIRLWSNGAFQEVVRQTQEMDVV